MGSEYIVHYGTLAWRWWRGKRVPYAAAPVCGAAGSNRDTHVRDELLRGSRQDHLGRLRTPCPECARWLEAHPEG